MDDIQISHRHQTWKVVERKLQDSIDIDQKFAQKNGFKFSTSKISVLHFSKLSTPPPIDLRLGNVRIQKSETVKYLGVVFDSKLDWKAHIEQLKKKCIKASNLMRSVSSTKWRTYQKTLIMSYRSLIRSKIGYGYIVYNSASNRYLESLEYV